MVVSRPRPPPATDVEAGTELKLGEFHNVPTLNLSEARYLLNAVSEAREKQPGARKIQDTESFNRIQDYLENFARFKQKERIESLEPVLSNYPNLESFERSQLASLCCAEAEEARALIPSLTPEKISNENLQMLLAEITQLREGEALD